MTSFSESVINRDDDGKFAAKTTAETSGVNLDGHDDTPSGPNMSYSKTKSFTPEVGQRVAVIARSGFGQDVTSVSHGTVAKAGKRDVHVELDNGNKTMFRTTHSNYRGGYSVDNGGSRFHTGPSVYPSDHPVTHNADLERQIASAKTTLRNNTESLDVALRQSDFDSAREVHTLMADQFAEIESAQSRMVEW